MMQCHEKRERSLSRSLLYNAYAVVIADDGSGEPHLEDAVLAFF